MNIIVNNVNIYYEVYGNGDPIILLHGNNENIKIFDKLIDKLKDSHEVYAIDTRCHGKSQKVKEISYDLIAADVIQFIKALNINNPILYGFSDGGIVGILIAIKEKHLLSKIIVSGANITPDGIEDKVYKFSKFCYTIFRDKKIKMMLYEPNITKEELASIDIPVVILAGENDAIKSEHTEFIHKNIKDSKLEIIKNENHGSYIIHSDKIYEIIKKYI
jgi:pimeloyl-ACP methyl ester carboxylesterase